MKEPTSLKLKMVITPTSTVMEEKFKNYIQGQAEHLLFYDIYSYFCN